MTHTSRGILPLPPWGWNSFPLEPNWTQVASASPLCRRRRGPGLRGVYPPWRQWRKLPLSSLPSSFPFPSVPSSFPFLPLSLPQYSFPLSLLPLSPPFPFPCREAAPWNLQGVWVSALAPPAGSGAELRPLMHSGWI